MKFILALYILGFGHTAASSSSPIDIISFMKSEKAQSFCEDTYQDENGALLMVETNSIENVYVFKQGMDSKLLFVNLQTWEERSIVVEGRITDISISENQIQLLTQDMFRILSINDFSKVLEFRTLPENMNYKKHSFATGFSSDEAYVYIAHGEYGVIKVDKLNTSLKTFINPAPPHIVNGHRSKVTDIVSNNSSLFFVYDNITNTSKTRGFEGLAIWNKSKNILEKFIPVNQKLEAYYLPKMKITSTQIVMQNLHLIFKFDLKRLKKSRYLKPVKRIWKVQNGKFTHRALIYEKLIAGCVKDNSSFQNSSVVHQ